MSRVCSTNDGCKVIELLDMRLVGKIERRFARYGCCICGSEFEARYDKSYIRESCGCKMPPIKHGGTYTKLYGVHSYMKGRCYRKTGKDYKNYGGRGITVCEEWKNDFKVFRDWAMTNGYKEGLQLDRRNNNGNYEPSNCRFVSHTVNNQNRRDNKLNPIKVNEIRKLYNLGNTTPTVLAKMYSVSISTIWDVVSNKTWKNV